MKKKIIFLCACVLAMSVFHPAAVSASENDWAIYPLDEMVDGFTPPEGETIQFMTGRAMKKEERLHRSFWKECITARGLRGGRMMRIANPVDKIPRGQQHRLTLENFYEKKQEVSWHTSNPDIVVVDPWTGELTALQTGSVRVWVTDSEGRVQDGFALEVVDALPQEAKEKMFLFDGSNVIGAGYWNRFNPWFDNVKDLFLPDDAPALADCFGSQRLGRVRIPASVKAIGSDTYYQYTRGVARGSKVCFSVDGNNTNYYSIGDVLFCYPFYVADDPERSYIKATTEHIGECGGRMLLCYPRERKGEVYYVPYGVERIADEAFSNVKYLRKVVLPDTVTSIGLEAISGSIEEIVIPASVTEIAGDSGRAFAIEYATIITPAGSAAEAYAIEHGIPYRNE